MAAIGMRDEASMEGVAGRFDRAAKHLLTREVESEIGDSHCAANGEDLPVWSQGQLPCEVDDVGAR